MAHALTRAEAAQRRMAGVRQRSDRPRRRSAGGGRASAPAHNFQLAASEPDETGIVTLSGVASATGAENGYEMWDWYGEYTEVIVPGAFANTLNRADLDCPLVIAHNQIRRIASTLARTLTLTETTRGLEILARCDMADEDTSYIVRKIRAKLIREMSFGFRLVNGIWSPDYEQYSILELDMHRGDTSIVGFGANPNTSIGEGATAPEGVDAGETEGDDVTCPECGEDMEMCGCGKTKTNARAAMNERQRMAALLDLALAR